MDREILEWISKEPQDWWQKTQSTIYTWGKGSWNQLGTSTRENSSPALAEEWKDVQQVPNCYMIVGANCSSHKECPPLLGTWLRSFVDKCSERLHCSTFYYYRVAIHT